MESVKHVPGTGTWGAGATGLEKTKDISLENSKNPNGTDLNVYLTGTGTGGGVAYLGTICKKGEIKWLASMTGWYHDD